MLFVFPGEVIVYFSGQLDSFLGIETTLVSQALGRCTSTQAQAQIQGPVAVQVRLQRRPGLCRVERVDNRSAVRVRVDSIQAVLHQRVPFVANHVQAFERAISNRLRQSSWTRHLHAPYAGTLFLRQVAARAAETEVQRAAGLFAWQGHGALQNAR
ncbi:hypothetical protein D3C76_1158260 [compost metagenome]